MLNLKPLLTLTADGLPPEVFAADDSQDEDDDEDGDNRPFVDLFKRRFQWYYHAYRLAIRNAPEKYKDIVKDQANFMRTEFECCSNEMQGKFQYTTLEKRLDIIKSALDKETAAWVVNGAAAFKNDSPTALAFQHHFSTVLKECKQKRLPIELEMEQSNPFVWHMVIFGQPMTNLDGGLFNVTLVFSKRFPDEQPRVKVETPLFHHRISPDGVLCYFPARSTDVRDHVEAIINAIQDEAPSYDPRTLVNPEASKLLWGSVEDKKIYGRRLRRSVQECSEI